MTEKETKLAIAAQCDKLKDLVPPLELLKLIPEGEFEDSVFIWMEVEASATMEKTWSLMQGTPYARQRPNRKIPAPTLQEILAALPPYGKNEQILACCVPDWADFDARVFGEHWRVGYTGDCSINDKNPATAALKLWLKLKGINCE